MAGRRPKLAAMSAVLAAAILAIGAPATISAVHELALRSRLDSYAAAPAGGAAEAGDRLASEVPRTVHERLDLALAMLAHAESPALAEEAKLVWVERAERSFREYLAEVPGDGRGWAGLASAEIRLGKLRQGADALRMSILTKPWSPSLEQWRCGMAIDLFAVLDAEERELMKGQFRMAARRSPATLVRTAMQRGGVRVARIFLASSPDELILFEAELAKLR
jgi:hypothetical protein